MFNFLILDSLNLPNFSIVRGKKIKMCLSSINWFENSKHDENA